ncbi:gliding motility-associated peptidyl-prolyl isomerase GldI [Hyunsoonleella sp. SJ7]|uniref:Peptidyl-prolyl cis-trans isomerase n=1 Tax=Hyunsoonleella aquatilis TaxID=2762758 RepID=A0A923H7X7_9FLAO|nr:gliding motility-associated peptidyl-prolyl isomerase GldI [Hyunsoonleella aquatilis]MBC3757563.1 gliding motility-associated peptidyl-prolyl isomerase GldI [Hyunsoonleella aquatilis]
MDKTLIIIGLLAICFSCKTPEARRPISVKSGSFIDASVERNKKLYAKEQAWIEQLMAKNDSTNYIASESGFWYYYNTKITESDNYMPAFGDIVNYSYNLKDFNGNLIYPKENFQNLEYAMDKQELFTGLREGLKLMKAGETITFLFPSQKAYGYYGDENKIGTNVPLIAEVTVNSITKVQDN